MLGDAGVEKTSITNRYCYNLFNEEEKITICVNFSGYFFLLISNKEKHISIISQTPLISKIGG